MKEWVLLIRKEDKDLFDLIKKGVKTVETRAATERYRRIKIGDKIIFSCDGGKLFRKVKSLHLFKTMEDIVEHISLRKILPQAKSLEEAKKIWLNFPDYPKKLKKYGLIAWELE